VPKAPHIDHTEHDLDVLVTEQGLADLRGLAPKDRAQKIIDKCVHPSYKPIMQEYLDLATKVCIEKGVGWPQKYVSKKVLVMSRNCLTAASRCNRTWQKTAPC